MCSLPLTVPSTISKGYRKMEDINKVVGNIKDDINKYASEVGSDNAEGRVEGLNLTLGRFV